MGGFLDGARRKVVLVAVGGALLATGLGFGAAAAVPSPDTRDVADTAPVTTTDAPPATSEPAATTPAGAPDTEAAGTAPATVDPVTPQQDTQPAPAPAAETEPAPEPSAEPLPDRSYEQGGLIYVPPPNPTMAPLPGEHSLPPAG